MAAVFKDKESEHNWESRHKDIIRLRGLLRGNAPEKYLDAVVFGLRLMVDGITKSTESLRTTLALDALQLVADIGAYLSKSLDAYMYDQFLNCLIRATSVSKKIVALQSKEAMIKFLQHANYYPKTPQLFWLAMNEKNNQVRHFVALYVKAMLHAHAPKEQVRYSMDRSGGTELIGKILEKGLIDATPIVRETCREPFWFFWYFWQERGDALLRHLPISILKPLERSKSTALASLAVDPLSCSPSNSTSSHPQHRQVSPSSSNTSVGSLDSATAKQKHAVSNNNNNTATGLHKRSLSPSLLRSTSPLVFRHATSSMAPPATAATLPQAPPSQGIQNATGNSDNSLNNNLRKSRVPGLSRKKSILSVKRKQSILAMLQQEDLAIRVEGLQALSRKLIPYVEYPVDVATIQVDAGGGTNALMVDGATFQSVLLTLFTSTLEQNNGNPKLYEALSTWDSVMGVMLKLIPFDEYLPKIMLDCAIEQQQPHQSLLQQKKDDEWIKFASASRAWARAKWYLKRHDPDLAEKIYNGLLVLDGSNSGSSAYHQSSVASKKKATMRPMERRKLTKQWLLWMDELVLRVIGLDNEDGADNDDDNLWLSEDGEDPALLRHGLGRTYWQDLFGNESTAKNLASSWFESDANVRQCLHLLLPLLSSSSPGSLWHEPLVTLVGHIRLINQKLFDMLVGTLDDSVAAKITRILGVHLRFVFPSAPTQAVSVPTLSSTNPETTTTTLMPIEAGSVDDHDDSHEKSKQESLKCVTSDGVSLIDQQASLSEAKNSEFHIENISATEKPDDSVNTSPIETINESIINSNRLCTDNLGAISQIEMTTLANNTKNDMLSLSNDSLSVGLISQEPPARPVLDASPLTDLCYPSPVPTASLSMRNSCNNENGGPISPHIHELSPSSNTHLVPALLATALIQCEETQASNNATTIKASNENLITKNSEIDIHIPKYVPYYAPNIEDISEWHPVFENNNRSEGTKDKAASLYQLVDKLKQYCQSAGTTAHQQHSILFRKLMRLSKEAPIQKKWDQGGSEEFPGSEMWASANKDGGNFVELVQVILHMLTLPQFSCCTLLILDLVRQLALAQTGLMRFYEMKLDRQGMTLESQLLEQLLEKRGSPNPTICTAAEDATEAVLVGLESQTVFEVFLAYLTYRLTFFDTPITSCEESMNDISNNPRYDPIASAFMFLGQSVTQVNNTLFIEEWLSRGGVAVFVKGLNYPQVQVRKMCVNAIVEFQEILGDDLYLFLGALRQDQLNLIRHYVNKSIKKKSSLRQLCANGQLR
ncbi:clasp N terminal-domain-containing protein [Chlamydoabsidia padenii]|nr:clasp N terminal-domain-containing protein [Chlamydoabsidia padenii]